MIQKNIEYKIVASKYMEKNVTALQECNPGQANRVLKRMGSQPGYCTDSNSFTLPSHLKDNLTNKQSAEKIADHFAEISNSFPPLCVNLLPNHVQTKINTDRSKPPVISLEETWKKIEAAEKPRSKDLPRELLKEHSVEIATPLNRIINNIM